MSAEDRIQRRKEQKAEWSKKAHKKASSARTNYEAVIAQVDEKAKRAEREYDAKLKRCNRLAEENHLLQMRNTELEDANRDLEWE